MAQLQTTKSSKGGKCMSTSPARQSHYKFYESNVYAKNKLKRIIRSCGAKFAQTWARKHTAETVLARLLK